MVYAGFWRRFAAHMIDYAIQMVIAVIFMVIVGMFIGISEGVEKAKQKQQVTGTLERIVPLSQTLTLAQAQEPSPGQVTAMPPVTPDHSIVVPQPGTMGAEPEAPLGNSNALGQAPAPMPPVTPAATTPYQPSGVTASPYTPSQADEDELSQGASVLITAIAYIFAFAMGIVYHTWFIGSPWQATPGKRVMGCIVVKQDGSRLSYLEAFFRHLACAVSGMTLSIGYMLAGWTKESTALHDMICNTRVVRTRTQTQIIGA